MKFLKCKRFDDNNSSSKPHSNSPKASSQSATNPSTTTTTTVVKPQPKSPSSVNTRSQHPQQQQPFFFYPSTSVPEVEMSFNRDRIATPAPGRYSPHDVTCKCFLTSAAATPSKSIKCPGSVEGDGHQHVFRSNVVRLVRPMPPLSMRRQHRRRWSKLENAATSELSFLLAKTADDSLMETLRARLPREPISFRVKSQSCDALDEMARRDEREFRFNTVIKRKHLVSVKTGRPVGFLTATPRFFELAAGTMAASSTAKKSDAVDRRKKAKEENGEEGKAKRRPMSKERLELLATPKNSQSKLCKALSAAVVAITSTNGNLNVLETTPTTVPTDTDWIQLLINLSSSRAHTFSTLIFNHPEFARVMWN